MSVTLRAFAHSPVACPTWSRFVAWIGAHPAEVVTASELKALLLIRRDFCLEIVNAQPWRGHPMNPRVHNAGCHISTLTPNNKGYVQPSLLGKKPLTLHVLSWLAHNVLGQIPPGCDISHLCGHSKCFAPDHLRCEPTVDNQRRKNCVVWVDCPHHGICLPGEFIVWVCVHQPYCIKNGEWNQHNNRLDDMVGLKNHACS